MLPIIARHRQQSRLVVGLCQKATVLLAPVLQSQCFRQFVTIADNYGRVPILKYGNVSNAGGGFVIHWACGSYAQPFLQEKAGNLRVIASAYGLVRDARQSSPPSLRAFYGHDGKQERNRKTLTSNSGGVGESSLTAVDGSTRNAES